jgi:hypothetical protein
MVALVYTPYVRAALFVGAMGDRGQQVSAPPLGEGQLDMTGGADDTVGFESCYSCRAPGWFRAADQGSADAGT